jgi:hypothetical protein
VARCAAADAIRSPIRPRALGRGAARPLVAAHVRRAGPAYLSRPPSYSTHSLHRRPDQPSAVAGARVHVETHTEPPRPARSAYTEATAGSRPRARAPIQHYCCAVVHRPPPACARHHTAAAQEKSGGVGGGGPILGSVKQLKGERAATAPFATRGRALL